MADGEHKLELTISEVAWRRLEDAAVQLGVSVDAYAARMIEAGLANVDDWAIDERIAAEMDRSGVSYSVQEGLAAFDAAMKSHMAKPGDL
ncbi:MAG: hypothetical protein JF588_18425 [Caulobacterales bacterium]|nr:hypothetical protein [Caulobacterales bacterium]